MFSENYEALTDTQKRVLERYVTNVSGHVFVLRNLPEVIKGALFSRYSRSKLGLRSLLLKDFISNDEEAAFDEIVGSDKSTDPEQQMLAVQRAQDFYDRILDGYGDDSIGELGGAHLAAENISMLAAKVIEDCRIGGSPLEKSTRYIYFDEKVNGEYLFHREPILMASAYRDIYVDTCNQLFETYSKLIPPVTELIQANFPHTPEMSKFAYNAALRAKVLDCLRGLLPAGALTNMGVYGNGRFFESLVRRLHGHSLAELQDIGRNAQGELEKVIPSFVRRGNPEHRHSQSHQAFDEAIRDDLRELACEHSVEIDRWEAPGVRLIGFDPDGPAKVAAALLYPHTDRGLSELQAYCRKLDDTELARIFDGASSHRENRRHKSPRGLEHATFTYEIVADFGAYRDLQRHRILTQDRQRLTCDYGYYVPPELVGTAMESEYRKAMDNARDAFTTIRAELPEEAQYVVPMGYNIRWCFHLNLRAMQWMCELRSSPQGHTSYRYIAQQMAKDAISACPAFEKFLGFVDFDGYELGRLDQETRKAAKAGL